MIILTSDRKKINIKNDSIKREGVVLIVTSVDGEIHRLNMNNIRLVSPDACSV